MYDYVLTIDSNLLPATSPFILWANLGHAQYERERGNPEDVEKGFLGSEPLVKVRASTTALFLRFTERPSLQDVQSHIHVTIFG